ncbi:MAG: asparagine synthase (glutamine-hydrolyzing) [Verrucomicrobia bacterium]|nr:asparagine synthase (glutamine-hydrolyzing) [Verrucomicrobiota bacterium]
MCGIAGMFNASGVPMDVENRMRRALASIRHRGPDEFGIYLHPKAALGNARLSIVDLEGGQQPICNEDGSLWIVFNGEIFNHAELRPLLESRGHRFSTRSDTEVILHLFEEMGPDCLHKLNGQFAIAIWDSRKERIFLARDRVGVRPVFLARSGWSTWFGSEIKALFNGGDFERKLNPEVIRQTFQFWAPLPGHTAFAGVTELEAGCYAWLDSSGLSIRRYWELPYTPFRDQPSPTRWEADERAEELDALLRDAVRIRLRADVPVGAYLSGGLDSSTITGVIRDLGVAHLDTFSIAFNDSQFDESEHQNRMAKFLGTKHQVVEASHADIGRVFHEVIWHTETPTMRTAPVPMFLLSRKVRDSGYKVVLTGEGADEFLGGYDLFKEAKIRRFWAREPDSNVRPRLIARLYPDIFTGGNFSSPFLEAFFKEGLGDTGAWDYSHAIRWRNNARNLRFFGPGFGPSGSRELRPQVQSRLPAAFGQWHPAHQAQYLETTFFMTQYLLSSQGDRVGMAHSIEGRFPFLDARMMEFCCRLSPRLTLRALREKHLLRQVAQRYLPRETAERRKRPYRAPIHKSLLGHQHDAFARELLSANALSDVGLFKSEAVTQLCLKADRGQNLGETDDMALAGILSSQILHHLFVKNFTRSLPLAGKDNVKVCRDRFFETSQESPMAV